MDRKTVFVGLGSFLLIIVVGVAVFIFTAPASFRGTTYDKPYPVAPEFELIHSDGSSFRLSQMRGNVVLLFFGYTSCPDVCPTTLAKLKATVAELPKNEAAHVKVLFVTVDPKRDTPDRVQTYASRFNANFIGLGGTEAQLAKVWQAYGVNRSPVSGASVDGDLIDHTARITAIDQNGDLRVSFGYDVPVDDLVHDLELLLKQ